MSTHTTNIPKKNNQLLRTLTLMQVVMIGLAYLQPLTIFDTFAIVAQDTGGHVPSAYIVALIAVLFTALSYGRLIQYYPSAGSAYTYVQKAIHPSLGFLVGWSSLMDYLLMPMINILLAKIYLTELLPMIPPWIFVVVLVSAMSYVNLKGIDSVANVNTFIVVVQIAVILIFVVLGVQQICTQSNIDSLLTLTPLYTHGMSIPAVITGATILCFSFLGFDGISSLAEETKEASHVIPKAIFRTALIGGIIFIIVSFVMQIRFPNAAVFQNRDASLPEIALMLGGLGFQSIILAFTCVTVVSSGMAAQTGVSRLLYVMGRDGVFPKKYFGYIHPRWRTPVFNVSLVGLLSLSAIVFDLDTALSLISFGALIAFSFVNLVVIIQCCYREKLHKTVSQIIRYFILPACGIITVTVMWFSLEKEAFTIGIIWSGVGLLYLILKTKFFTVPLLSVNETDIS